MRVTTIIMIITISHTCTRTCHLTLGSARPQSQSRRAVRPNMAVGIGTRFNSGFEIVETQKTFDLVTLVLLADLTSHQKKVGGLLRVAPGDLFCIIDFYRRPFG